MNIPEMRFRDFNDEWQSRKLDDITNGLDNLRIPVEAAKRIKGNIPYYGANGIQDFVRGFTHNGKYILIAEDGASNIKDYPIYYVEGKFWANNHVHVITLKKYNKGNNVFLSYSLKTINLKPYLVGGTRLKLTANDLMKIKVKIPQEQEQQKIGAFFSKLDALISAQSKKVTLLKQLKHGYLQRMFPQADQIIPRVRFKDFNDEWKLKKISEMLNYEQPTKYIVKSTEYSDNYNIPVLTANKSFILGYTGEKEGIYTKECIIFDDFTQESKYVNFPFKVKSSAIKILTAKVNDDLYFIYNLLKVVPFIDEGHRRYYIDIVQNRRLLVPCIIEQQKISAFFSKLDHLIELQNHKLALLQQLKKGYLQNMFC